ncbi:MAG: isopropylmalate isomerase [Roseobacter sp. MedPE-SW]|nr:MAG: isopropylmalate isomerase [Roseobacter sp. MedPE-SW]
MYLTPMTLVLAQTIELQDRARLRERFYGAARTVLARL